MILWNIQELGKLHAARVAWKNPHLRARLIYVWTHREHPHAHRFLKQREMWEKILACSSSDEVTQVAGTYGHTLRTIAKDLPGVFWSLWDESRVNAAAQDQPIEEI